MTTGICGLQVFVVRLGEQARRLAGLRAAPQSYLNPPAEVKSERLHRVEEIEHRISLEQNRKLVGTTQQVLVEGFRGEQPFGRTRGGRLVHIGAPARVATMVDVAIEHAGPFSVRGAPADTLVLAAR